MKDRTFYLKTFLVSAVLYFPLIYVLGKLPAASLRWTVQGWLAYLLGRFFYSVYIKTEKFPFLLYFVLAVMLGFFLSQ